MRKKEGNTQDAGKEFLQAVEFVEKEKGIKKEDILAFMEQALNASENVVAQTRKLSAELSGQNDNFIKSADYTVEKVLGLNAVLDKNCQRLDEFSKDSEGRYHLDLFMLTHPDEDHCRGIDTNYYLGNPEKYSDEDLKNDLVIIDELMVTPMLFTGATSEPAKALKKEAERRRKLWDDNSRDKTKAGNRLVIIGYDDYNTI